MFEFIFGLIGYWVSVSLVVLVSLYGVFIYSVALLDCYITRATEGDTKYLLSDKINNWFSLWDNKGSFQEFPVAVGGISLVASIVLYSTYCLRKGNPPTEVVHNISSAITPVLTYIAPIIISLVLLDKLIKKGYHYSKILKKLETSDK